MVTHAAINIVASAIFSGNTRRIELSLISMAFFILALIPGASLGADMIGADR
jgi:hypothetical protein